MGAAFTPGPWAIREWDNARDGWKISANGKQIAVSCYLGGTEPARVNGQIIAAAPELYEACEDLAERMIGAFPSLADTPEVKRAKAALAKARGDQ
jgi:hypothetical protein